MDKDVQSKLQKLCNHYLNAQSQIDLLRPSKLLSNKRQRQAQTQVVSVLGELREARRPIAAALLRLAYVRAMREVTPGARLSLAQQHEIAALSREFVNRLRQQETQTLASFRRHLRRLSLADQMDELGYPPQTQAIMRQTMVFPLEQRVRECALSMVAAARAAGTAAATGYDEVQDAA